MTDEVSALQPAFDPVREVRRSSGWFLVVGFVLIILGTLAVSVPVLTGIVIEFVLGGVLIAGGVVQGLNVFQATGWRNLLTQLPNAVLALTIGILLILFPNEGLLTLTLLLGIFFAVEGIFKIAIAFQIRPLPSWFWMLSSGIVALLLAIFIWMEYPSDARWVIGLILGIDLIFGGWSMIMIGMTMRQTPLT